ncbi:MAG TPA: thiosulfate oxidation carrier complex protein SoxZ [Pseudolabrys sp.]|nr:thiosulfate oxidation carrier complex protein SoxZ [Pseudolabrys sp.]
MAPSSKPRIWISTRTPPKGSVVTVKTMVTHPMETGMRKNAQSMPIPRNIIERFECSLAGDTLMSWQLDTAISQNPYLEFRFVAQRSGELKMLWVADDGARIEVIDTITVA